MSRDLKLRLKNIHYNFDPYRGKNTYTDQIDLNGDGVIDEYERMTANMQAEEPPIKTYFPVRGKNGEQDPRTKHFIFNLPTEFVNSNKDRYISFQYCRATCNHSLDGETEVHASFIPRDDYCDSLVWYANILPPDDNRKYEIINTKRNFEVWFCDAEGKIIIPDNFVLFLKLEY